MIRQLRIRGFKSITELDIALGRVNCFIGANGVGKSNVLEALGVLGAAANGVVDDEALQRRGVRPGLPRLFKSSFQDVRSLPHIGLEAIGQHGATYRVSLLNPLESPEPAWSFKTETLTDGVETILTDGVRSRGNLNPKAGLAALRLVELPTDSAATRLLLQLQQYAIYCPNTPTLRGLVPDPRSAWSCSDEAAPRMVASGWPGGDWRRPWQNFGAGAKTTTTRSWTISWVSSIGRSMSAPRAVCRLCCRRRWRAARRC